MVGTAGEVNAAAADLEEEEDVEVSQPDGVDNEEVDGEEMVSMLADELVPRALAATSSWRQAMAAEQVADGVLDNGRCVRHRTSSSSPMEVWRSVAIVSAAYSTSTAERPDRGDAAKVTAQVETVRPLLLSVCQSFVRPCGLTPSRSLDRAGPWLSSGRLPPGWGSRLATRAL
jgi:hypothetical protein